jgi:hypothetical protein
MESEVAMPCSQRVFSSPEIFDALAAEPNVQLPQITQILYSNLSAVLPICYTYVFLHGSLSGTTVSAKAVHFSEVLAPMYQSTRRHFSEGLIINGIFSISSNHAFTT